jgi:hypothetical protein
MLVFVSILNEEAADTTIMRIRTRTRIITNQGDPKIQLGVRHQFQRVRSFEGRQNEPCGPREQNQIRQAEK